MRTNHDTVDPCHPRNLPGHRVVERCRTDATDADRTSAMSTLLPASRRAEKFAALVDAHVDHAGPTSRYAPDLLEVVGTLRAAADEAAGAPRRLRRRPARAADGRGRHRAGPDRRAAWCCRSGTPPTRKQSRVTAAAAAWCWSAGRRHGGRRPEQRCRARPLPVKRGIEHVGESAQPLRRRPRHATCSARPSARLGEVDSAARARRHRRRGGRDARQLHQPAPATAPTCCSAPTSANGDDGDIATVRDFAGTEMGDAHATCPPRAPSVAAARLRRRPPSCWPTSTSRPRCSAPTAVPRGPLELPARPAAGLARRPRSWTCSRRPRRHRLDARRPARRSGATKPGSDAAPATQVRRPGEHRRREPDHPAAARRTCLGAGGTTPGSGSTATVDAAPGRTPSTRAPCGRQGDRLPTADVGAGTVGAVAGRRRR